MIKDIYIYNAIATNPYENLAQEEYMLSNLPENSCILYLWQNLHTVVIGKNQNAWQECKVEQIEKDGGFLVRRLSGGGAVFHDMGNLNFTFIMPIEDYSISKQLDVVKMAVDSFGLKTEKSGRNDLTIDGRKFSGNAFCKKSQNAYHHGTILIDANMENVAKYLNVSAPKLKSNGAESVRSRVVNLGEYSTEITIKKMKDRLTNAFEDVYGKTPKTLPDSFWDANELKNLRDKYASWEWRLGRKVAFETVIEDRFSWGGLSLGLAVGGGIIQDATVFSDAMDCDTIAEIPKALKQCKFEKNEIVSALEKLLEKSEKSSVFEGFEPQKADNYAILQDICGLIKKCEL